MVDKEKEPCRNKAQQIKNALTRINYRDDDEKLRDAQAYIWLSIGVVCISLIIFLVKIVRYLQ